MRDRRRDGGLSDGVPEPEQPDDTVNYSEALDIAVSPDPISRDSRPAESLPSRPGQQPAR